MTYVQTGELPAGRARASAVMAVPSTAPRVCASGGGRIQSSHRLPTVPSAGKAVRWTASTPSAAHPGRGGRGAWRGGAASEEAACHCAPSGTRNVAALGRARVSSSATQGAAADQPGAGRDGLGRRPVEHVKTRARTAAQRGGCGGRRGDCGQRCGSVYNFNGKVLQSSPECGRVQ